MMMLCKITFDILVSQILFNLSSGMLTAYTSILSGKSLIKLIKTCEHWLFGITIRWSVLVGDSKRNDKSVLWVCRAAEMHSPKMGRKAVRWVNSGNHWPIRLVRILPSVMMISVNMSKFSFFEKVVQAVLSATQNPHHFNSSKIAEMRLSLEIPICLSLH